MLKQKLVSAAALCAALALPAFASAADLNIPVATRVISFLQPPPSGTILAAIVYEPGNAASEEEAASIERAGALSTGKAAIHLKRVAVGALGGLTGSRVAFVTSGLRDQQGQIAAAASRLSILTITSDLACVQAAHCVVAVSGAPRVQITVSRAASKAANIQFGSAFLMLVKEI